MQNQPAQQVEPGVWLNLSTILNLPLSPREHAVVLREILLQPSLNDFPQNLEAKVELTQLLTQMELVWAIDLCRQGHWSEGLNRLEGLLERCDFEGTIGPEILELLPDLHYQLVDLAEESPSRCPFDEAERAELLWSCHNWLGRLNACGLEQPERMAAIHEQIYRYGALVWMPMGSPLANRRSLDLLLALSEVNPTAMNWTKPACMDRLGREIEAFEQMMNVAQPTNELIHLLNSLFGAICRFQRVFQGDEGGQSRQLVQAILDANSALEVWARLKLA